MALIIKDLTEEQLKNKAVLEKIIKSAEEYIQFEFVNEAKELALQLEEQLRKYPGLETENPEIFLGYKKLISQLKFTALIGLNDKETFELMEKGLKDVLDSEIDVLNVLKGKLLIIPGVLRDSYLEELRGALRNNEQRIGTQPIKIDNEAVAPTIKNWLEDYSKILGPEYHDPAERIQYLFQSPNVNLLSDKDKEILKALLKLYDALKLDIREPDGLGSYPLDMLGIEVKAKSVEVPAPPAPAVSKPSLPERKTEIEAARLAEVRKRLAKTKLGAPLKMEEIKPPESLTEKPALLKEEEVKPTLSPQMAEKPKEIVKSQGPVPKALEDLKNLDINNFRQINPSPKEGAKEIINRINSAILADPAISRVQALDIWRQSSLYNLYLEIGRRSMSTRRPVKELAEERKSAGQPYLTQEEFEAIAEISGSIG